MFLCFQAAVGGGESVSIRYCCDGPDCQQNWPLSHIPMLEEGWFVAIEDGQHLHFCSHKCADTWIAKREKEARG